MSSLQVFISYAHEDVEKARKLVRELKNAGVNPWFDEESLSPGQRWEHEISKAIDNSRYFIPLLSRNSVMNKGFVQKEVKDALDIMDEISPTNTYLLPVRLDEVETTNKKLAGLHRVDLFLDWNRGVENLVNVIKAMRPPLSPKTKRAMRTSEIGLGIIGMIFSILFLATLREEWAPCGDPPAAPCHPIALLHYFGNSTDGIVAIALAILGVERLITGIFGVGRGRMVILSLGIVVLILTAMGIYAAIDPRGEGGIALTSRGEDGPVLTTLVIASFAFFVDGTGRIYFGIKNQKFTSRWSRNLSIVTGIIEIIIGIYANLSPGPTTVKLMQPNSLHLTVSLPPLLVAVCLAIVAVQMMAAGISGRQLRIGR